MVAELVAAVVVVLAASAEMLHARRCRRLAPLAFGPSGHPEAWARAAPYLRVASAAAVAWGLVTLLLLPPKVHRAEDVPIEERRHLLLALDVSPSMRLVDAGPGKDRSRQQRVSDLMESFFQRVGVGQYRMSVIAFYTGAKPVVVDTSDMDVVRNILSDLPMHYAFKTGKTDLFSGLAEAARIAHGWNPRSATLLVLTDGDTVPAIGLPEMPASVRDAVVVGVGDPVAGKFIDGRQSRQDASTLRQVAHRLGGTYHDGNEKHLASDLLQRLTSTGSKSPFEALGRREYALLLAGIGAALLALLPLLLNLAGTRWRPGVPSRGLAEGSPGRASRALAGPQRPHVARRGRSRPAGERVANRGPGAL